MVVDAVVACRVSARAALSAAVRAGDLGIGANTRDLCVGTGILESDPLQPDVRVKQWPARQLEIVAPGQLVHAVATGLDVDSLPVVLGENLSVGNDGRVNRDVVNPGNVVETAASAATSRATAGASSAMRS